MTEKRGVLEPKLSILQLGTYGHEEEKKIRLVYLILEWPEEYPLTLIDFYKMKSLVWDFKYTTVGHNTPTSFSCRD